MSSPTPPSPRHLADVLQVSNGRSYPTVLGLSCVANPVWFGWDGEHLLFSQTTGRQKYKNLRRDDRIAISIVDPANDYRYLEIRGRVIRIDPDPAKAFIDSMARKYLGQETYPWSQPGDERVVMVVAVEHTTQMGG